MVLTTSGGYKIGSYHFQDRKKPCLCIVKGNTCVVYGTFNNDMAADNFMRILAKVVGAADGKENEQ